MNNVFLHNRFNFAISLLENIRKILLPSMNNQSLIQIIPTQNRHKGIVTNYDIAVHNYINDAIETKFPGDIVCSEEGVNPLDIDPDGNYWILDPIDGTRNFYKGIDIFSVTFAYIHRGMPEFGIILHPGSGDQYIVRKKSGAQKNQRRLKTYRHQPLYPVFCIPHHRIDTCKKILPHSFRSFGSISMSLCYLAEGCVDLVVLEQYAPWDLAAGILLCQESGAFVQDIHGNVIQSFKSIFQQETLLISYSSNYLDKYRSIIWK